METDLPVLHSFLQTKVIASGLLDPTEVRRNSGKAILAYAESSFPSSSIVNGFSERSDPFKEKNWLVTSVVHTFLSSPTDHCRPAFFRVVKRSA